VGSELALAIPYSQWKIGSASNLARHKCYIICTAVGLRGVSRMRWLSLAVSIFGILRLFRSKVIVSTHTDKYTTKPNILPWRKRISLPHNYSDHLN